LYVAAVHILSPPEIFDFYRENAILMFARKNGTLKI